MASKLSDIPLNNPAGSPADGAPERPRGIIIACIGSPGMAEYEILMMRAARLAAQHHVAIVGLPDTGPGEPRMENPPTLQDLIDAGVLPRPRIAPEMLAIKLTAVREEAPLRCLFNEQSRKRPKWQTPAHPRSLPKDKGYKNPPRMQAGRRRG